MLCRGSGCLLYVQCNNNVGILFSGMSRKSEAVGDIVPLDCGKLLVDYTLLSEQLENITLQVSEIGDEFAEKISSKTNRILFDAHKMEYFICGMHNSLFKQDEDLHENLHEVAPEEKGNVRVRGDVKGIKCRNKSDEASATQSESVPVQKKKTERDAAADNNTNNNDVKVTSA